MADEVTPLVSFFNISKNVVALFHFTRCQSSCVQSKGAIVAIVWSVLLVTALGTTLLLSNQFPTIFFNLFPVTYVIMVVLYPIVPALGLLGEKWTRYNVLMLGSVTMSISYTLVVGLIMLNQFIDIGSTVLPIVLVIAFCPYFFGLMLFIANIIQFGTDQLPFVPSEQLRSFIYWNFWPYYLTSTIILFVLSVVTTLVVQNANLYIGIFLFGSTFIAICVGFLSVCCFKHHLIIEPAQYNNPVKLIWRVVRYALKNKEPVNPSAFTYGESPPSRLDLAKERYGGPFTTGQVEDVKSFLYILSVLLTSYGISFNLSFSSNLSNQYLAVLNLGGNRTATFTERMILQFPLTIPFFVFSMYILTSQLLIFPFFSRFIPSMLKRIWIGLVGVLLQLAITTVIVYIVNRDITRSFDNVVCLEMTGHNTSYYDAGMEIFTLPYLVVILPQFLSGISSVVVTVTGFEFIMAQGPRNMQGLLIGLWLIEGNVFFNINSFCYWEYYAIITILALISVIVYTIAAYKYKYRQRNELSDVNERIIITEYTERQLFRKYNIGLEDQLHYEINSMIVN